MSMEYIERRVQEALELHLGNTHKARQQVIAWTYEDENLLYALAKPHLSGIVAYHIERVASGRAEAAKKGPPPAPKPSPEQHKPAKTKANVDADEFGLNILKAVTGERPVVFGLEDPGAPRKKQGVSKNHLDAISSIATRKISKPKDK